MQMIARQSFEVQTGNRNYQFVLNSDSPIDEYIEVLAAVYHHYMKVREESEKKKQNIEVVQEEPKQE